MDSCLTSYSEFVSFAEEKNIFWPTSIEMKPAHAAQPPVDIDHVPADMMFGFLLPDEWLSKQCEATNHTVSMEKVQIDCQRWFPFFVRALFPEWPRSLIKCTLAWIGTRKHPRRYKCFFLRVGLSHRGRIECPPQDLLEKMKEELATRYGIVESPGWYRDALPDKKIVASY
ncbi:hypothetical protein EIP91_010339 [Steccherinum ochraceum]|uniref:Uncharacterized protein n=1 Tax=Steccherinum ochraceum TaxID=92696 RepID=A0A4R0R0Q2_9APHY|nr:hypothetical protein EIP91_010339 [Steccherinum ochraceum]